MGRTGHENHAITHDEAKTIIKNFRDDAHPGDSRSGFFGRDAILAILGQADVVGIRFYFARKARGGPMTLVLAGETSTGTVLDTTADVLAEEPPLCPPICNFADTIG